MRPRTVTARSPDGSLSLRGASLGHAEGTPRSTRLDVDHPKIGSRRLQAQDYGHSAEGVGFEPTRTLPRPSGFQDRRTRPLCEPSRCLKVPNCQAAARTLLRVRGRRDVERGAGSVRPDEPPIPERVVVRLPIQDLTHLMRHAVRISVKHGKQVGPLGGRSVAAQLAFQLLPALPRGPPRRAIRTEKKHPRRKSRWDLPVRSCLGHGCLPAGFARCCSSTLHRPEAA